MTLNWTKTFQSWFVKSLSFLEVLHHQNMQFSLKKVRKYMDILSCMTVLTLAVHQIHHLELLKDYGSHEIECLSSFYNSSKCSLIFFDITCSKQVPRFKMWICSGTQLTTNVNVTTGCKYNWVIPLGTTSRSRNKNWPINIHGPFSFKKFIFFFMFIYCMPKLYGLKFWLQ